MPRGMSDLEWLQQERGRKELVRHQIDREIAELDEQIGAIKAAAAARIEPPAVDGEPVPMPAEVKQARLSLVPGGEGD